ncbi:MAG TPA: maleylpyruvate isomerase family mycothiol-dependent enzyme [Chloroflexota bacterium]|nr:maleylpyruvate isomerase family mycothiol-dependent enzyme [Chloroflexota bacterium]
MPDLPQPRRSLERLDSEQRRLCDMLLRLTPAELDLPSNLPGWRVLDLAVHITRVCDSIRLAVQRASVGDHTPAFGAAAKPREDAIRAMRPDGWVTLQRDAYADLTRVVGELTDAQLERFDFPHPQGQRSVRWFCTQLLAEVAFHRWDLERSLGGREPLDDDLATYLLPFLLDPTEPLFGLRRAPQGTATFSVASDGLSWELTTTDQGTTVRPGVARAGAGAGPTIHAAPSWLALAVYGRVRVDAPGFVITGPIDTADRFAAIFGPTPV